MKVICAASLLMAATGLSQGTLDQIYDPTQANTFAVNFGHSHGQTFTVGLSGYITVIDVFIGRNEIQTAGDIAWTLRSTVAGVPVAGAPGVLASGTIPYGSLPGPNYTYQPCLISPSLIPVTAGTVLGITLSSDHMFSWAGNNGSPYPRGSHQVATTPDGPWIPDPGVDLGFKTFVQDAPEPSTVAIVCLGGCVILMTLGRRTQHD